MFEDIGRCHGVEVQDSLRSTLSEAGRNELVNMAFLHGARNRSDDRLGRTSSALLATLNEKVGDDDVFRTIACVVAANNADVFAFVLDLLTLGSFDMDAMYRKIRHQWHNGLGGRCYKWLMDYVRDAPGTHRNVKWGACVWLQSRVLPTLLSGGTEK